MAHTCSLPEDPSPQSLFVCPSCGATWEAAVQNGIFDFEIQAVTTRSRWLLVETPAPARLLAG